MSTAIEFDNISKLYRLGYVSGGTLTSDLQRWWQMNILGKEDPFLKVGSVNDRSKAADSDYVWALRDINFKVEQGVLRDEFDYQPKKYYVKQFFKKLVRLIKYW